MDRIARRARAVREIPRGQASHRHRADRRGGAAAAERARSVLRIEAVLRERLAEQDAEPLFREIEMPLVTVLARMQSRGVRIDTALLGAIGAELEQRMKTLLGEIYAIAGTE